MSLDPDAWRTWAPDAQRKALEIMQANKESRWHRFYCKSAGCDGRPHVRTRDGRPCEADRYGHWWRESRGLWICDPEFGCGKEGWPTGDGWEFPHARSDQRPPPWHERWLAWLVASGRGGGKNETGSRLMHHIAKRESRMIFVAQDASALRETMVEGVSGILATAEPGKRPKWEPSRKKLTWPNGAVAVGYSAEEPDRLRGPQCLVAGTLVATASGEIPIEDLRPGAMVWTRKGLRQVTHVQSNVREVMTLRHRQATITGTPDHRIWTSNRGWVEMQFVEPKDVLVRWSPASTERLASSPALPPPAPSGASTSGPTARVYDLTVEGEPEFYANGVLVHNSGFLWLDEAAHYPLIDDVWSNALFGLRLGSPSHILVTSTPKPVPWLKELMKSEKTILTRVSTYANLYNLDPAYRQFVIDSYEGTRIGRQELHGELLEDVEGSLWSAEMIRRSPEPESFDRIVVSVDPAGTAAARSDETGIVVIGMKDAIAYVLADLTGKYTPAGWGKKAWWAHEHYSADCIVAEKNFGGDMVRHVLDSATGERARIHLVQSRRGKKLRAEPMVTRYERERVFHCGSLGVLEDEMLAWVPGQGASPNRVDALVHGLTELFRSAGAAGVARPAALLPRLPFGGSRPRIP